MAENGDRPRTENVKLGTLTHPKAELETMSHSNTSITSQPKLKAELCETKLRFKEQEAELLRKKAYIDEKMAKAIAESECQQRVLEISLELMKSEREHAEAVAEMRACEDLDYKSEENASVIDKKEFTRQYIDGLHPVPGITHQNQTEKIQPSALPPVYNQLNELSNFLAKKEMKINRLSVFNDKPEQFIAWRNTFKCVVSELNLQAGEELDLLVNHLGTESKRFAENIRCINVHDPEKGLQDVWSRLNNRYGKPELIESILMKKIANFPKIQGNFSVLYDLLDLLGEVKSLKEQKYFCSLLSYFDTSSGVNPIVDKLPYGMQDKWAFHASTYKRQHDVAYPPFHVFIDFIRDICETKNDPSFQYGNSMSNTGKDKKSKHHVFSRKQDVGMEQNSIKLCPLHKTGHSLNECKTFQKRSIDERKGFLRENKICFRCCDSNEHISKDCKASLKCAHCEKKHASALHIDNYQPSNQTSYGGERGLSVNSKCTALCNDEFVGKSCSKTVLVDVYPRGQPEKSKRVYAIIDDQSNKSLGANSLFDSLCIQGNSTQYLLSSCSGSIASSGRVAHDLCVKSVRNPTEICIKSVLECDDLPNEISEIPTPDVARAYNHLSGLAHEIPELDPNCKIELLIGRDIPEAHHVLEQVTGEKGSPFAQHLPLGWVIIGEICLGLVHTPKVNVYKVNILPNGRSTHLEPCQYRFQVKENSLSFKGDSLFLKTDHDEKIGLSVEDRQFLALMDKNMTRDNEGFWTAPLPFRNESQVLDIPNNRSQAWHRAKILDSSLKKNPVKKQHFVAFMDKIFKNGAAKVCQSNSNNCFYLPLFGVYHPRKPDSLRGVFDSSAVYEGVSLNNLLMTGPDLTNSLIGILLRFRKDAVAITGDIEQMFYRFRVNENHQRYLKFLWYRNNDPNDKLIEYQMCVHVFGNCASPAVATYGLNKSVENADDDVKELVRSDFYVDDALTSRPTASKVIDLMKRTKSALYSGGNLRLHKIASNSPEVIQAFPSEDLGSDLKELDFDSDDLPTQRSLGVVIKSRNHSLIEAAVTTLKDDRFLFKTILENKPFTRRGLLSMVNSIFDPLGFISPLTVTGKILLREATPPGVDWDEPLSTQSLLKWNNWKQTVDQSEAVSISRMMTSISFSEANKIAVYIFSDASEKAVAAVSYIKMWDKNDNSHIGFLSSKAKLAPQNGQTIPRLELCAAVLATELAEIIATQLRIPLDCFTYFTDSKVVLGYICNVTRRFHTYVSNRVEKILRITKPIQWRYVSSNKNPADVATRPITDANLFNRGLWFNGPKFIHEEKPLHREESFPLISPNDDKEIRRENPVSTLKTLVTTHSGLGCQRFERFSSWNSLIRAIMRIKLFMRKGSSVQRDCETDLKDTETFVLKEVQRDIYADELTCLHENRRIAKNSTLLKLAPFVDNKGLLRVGGRLGSTNEGVLSQDIHPIIMPKNHHVSLLLIRHYHEEVKHQGRILTEGALRKAGFWITGAKHMISSIIYKCLICRRLRRDTEIQRMADLPAERITPGPAFTSIGVDTFGPWEVSTRKTRGGSAKSKRWAILFTCLTSRAVHIELVEEMSSSSFINAFRRFQSIRGPVKCVRSDRGTNFVGATDDMNIDAIKVEEGPFKSFLDNHKIQWIFNVPHSSHMGGVWERVIGMTRRILDSILYETRHQPLTHETLSTFMAEVCAILNDRPLGQISTDPSSPCVIRPSMLLTGKSDILAPIGITLGDKDAYRAMWKRVQVMAEEFWKIWKRDYVHLLNTRKKWHFECPNLRIGDVVLLRDSSEHRNNWPLGVISNVFPSKDKVVRKVEIRIIKEGKPALYLRPVNEVVLLLNY